ncbi:ribonuclease toxin immunity protein CdiI [Pseudomonas japonica]|uniref:ribonuclease toxin immunity protein CdiI n=1 Tax=Pseudomonas japonica TaxID=256466 RepID=UPI003810A7D6
MDFPIVLEENLFPMQAFFNAMPARSLISVLTAFCGGVGAGFNDAVCEFPDELNEGETQFEGVRFYIFDEELTVASSEFFDVLSKVCFIYIERYPDMSEEVGDLLEKLAVRLRERDSSHPH